MPYVSFPVYLATRNQFSISTDLVNQTADLVLNIAVSLF